MAEGQKRLGESELIKKYFAPLCHPEMSYGLSDDAAFLTLPDDQQLVLTKDMLVADVHFFADDDPQQIAQKALRVNLSDLASKGAEPVGYLLGLGLPAQWNEEWLARFCSGLKLDQDCFSFPLIGGDTVKSPERLTISITAFGRVPRGITILRKNARPHDDVYVTGTIGDGALGLLVRREPERYGDLLCCGDREFLLSRFLLPQPRLQMRQLIRQFATASMDISDGLLGDARKMAVASGTSICLEDDAIPLSGAALQMLEATGLSREIALGGGDDYELLFCAAPKDHSAIMELAQELNIRLTKVGGISEGEGVRLVDSNGKKILFTGDGSYEHF